MMCLATGAGPANTGMQAASTAEVIRQKRTDPIERSRTMIAIAFFNFIP
jgi:hypothetical protein